MWLFCRDFGDGGFRFICKRRFDLGFMWFDLNFVKFEFRSWLGDADLVVYGGFRGNYFWISIEE